MKKAALYALILAQLAGILTSVHAEDRVSKEYMFDLNVSKVNNKQINIDVQTNFPDGAILSFYGTRIFYQQGSSQDYAGDLFSGRSSVSDGKAKLVVDIDDSEWIDKHNENVSKFIGLIDIAPIGRIDPNVIVRVILHPDSQPGHVEEQLGADGRYIGGSGAEKAGNRIIYSVKDRINVPVNR